jgi:hypothetical protein
MHSADRIRRIQPADIQSKGYPVVPELFVGCHDSPTRTTVGSGASESFLGGFRAEARAMLLRGVPCPARAIPPSYAPALKRGYYYGEDRKNW